MRGEMSHRRITRRRDERPLALSMNTYQRFVLIAGTVAFIMTPSYYIHQEMGNVINILAPTCLLLWGLKNIR